MIINALMKPTIAIKFSKNHQCNWIHVLNNRGEIVLKMPVNQILAVLFLKGSRSNREISFNMFSGPNESFTIEGTFQKSKISNSRNDNENVWKIRQLGLSFSKSDNERVARNQT